MEITVIISLFTALAAISAPIITSFIQYKTSIVLKGMENIYTVKLEIYRCFAKQFGILYASRDDNGLEQFNHAASEVVLICDQTSREKVNNLVKFFESLHGASSQPDVFWEFATPFFTDCCISLNKDLELSATGKWRKRKMQLPKIRNIFRK